MPNHEDEQLAAAQRILELAWGPKRKQPGEHSGALAAAFGDPHASLVLCQIMKWAYWQRDPRYVVHLSGVQLEEATGLTPKRQRGAMKTLIGLGVVLKHSGGRNNKNHFRVDYLRLLELMEDTAGRTVSQTEPAISLMLADAHLSFDTAFDQVQSLREYRARKRRDELERGPDYLGPNGPSNHNSHLSPKGPSKSTNAAAEEEPYRPNGLVPDGPSLEPIGLNDLSPSGSSLSPKGPNPLNGLRSVQSNGSKIDQLAGTAAHSSPLAGTQSVPARTDIKDSKKSVTDNDPSGHWFRSLREAFGSSDDAALEKFRRLLENIAEWSDGDRAGAIVALIKQARDAGNDPGAGTLSDWLDERRRVLAGGTSQREEFVTNVIRQGAKS